MSLTDLIQSLNIRALYHRVVRLEERMATTDELVGRLRSATDRLAEKVRRLSEGDPRFGEIISELEAMGADPSNPVPEPAP